MGNFGARFFEGPKTRPVLAGLRDPEQIESAIRHDVGAMFILGGDIFALQDLIKGVGRDEAGVRFLAKHVGIDGILTTRSNLVSPARREGLIVVQRLFVLDSESLTAGPPVVEKAAPDAVEVLPGVILPIIAQELTVRGTLPPLIAGGLIRTAAQVEAVLGAGAVAVSTSQTSLWGYRRDESHFSGRKQKPR